MKRAGISRRIDPWTITIPDERANVRGKGSELNDAKDSEQQKMIRNATNHDRTEKPEAKRRGVEEIRLWSDGQ